MENHSQVVNSKNDYDVCSSFINIRGESNINSFSFRYNKSAPDDTWETSGKIDTEFYTFTVPVRNFEASNPLMYNDFLTLIKAQEYPVISIILPKEPIKRAFQGQKSSCPDIEIALAGVKRVYQIDCNLYECGENIYIRGVKMIRLSDFSINPPVKLNGLVKVRDEIEVNFGLIVNFDAEKPTTASR